MRRKLYRVEVNAVEKIFYIRFREKMTDKDVYSEIQELGRWLSGRKHWLFFHKTWVQPPTPAWQVT